MRRFRLNTAFVLLLLAKGAIFSPVYSQVSSIQASLPNITTSSALPAPTVTAPTQSNYASFGSVDITSSYAGSTSPGGSGVLTFYVNNTAAPSTSLIAASLTTTVAYTDPSGTPQSSSGQVPVTWSPFVNNIINSINVVIQIPVTEFVVTSPDTSTETYTSNGTLTLTVPSLDGGGSVPFILQGTYE